MEKVLIFNMEKCTGCKVCELVCSMAKTREFNPGKSLIAIFKNKEMDTNMAVLDLRCDYCNECVEWCMPKALKIVDYQEAISQWKGATGQLMPVTYLSHR